MSWSFDGFLGHFIGEFDVIKSYAEDIDFDELCI